MSQVARIPPVARLSRLSRLSWLREGWPRRRPRPRPHQGLRTAPPARCPRRRRRPSTTQAVDNAGYDSADAQPLARLWRTDDSTPAEAIAGRSLFDGDALPIRPGRTATTASRDLTDALTARDFDEGLDDTDANDLAKL